MDKYAVIVAAGNGSRMASALPKQFLPLAGKTVIHHTLAAFLQAFSDIQIILVLPEAHLQKGQEIANEYQSPANSIAVVVGGASRFQSVFNGLRHVTSNSIVFVHDGVRCLVSPTLITNCYRQALELGSAIPAVAATDTIRIMSGQNSQVADRQLVRLVQTPQTFRSSILLPAFAQPELTAFTDEASVVEASGSKVFLIDGEYDNIKITRPLDLMIAEKIMQHQLTLKQP